MRHFMIEDNIVSERFEPTGYTVESIDPTDAADAIADGAKYVGDKNEPKGQTCYCNKGIGGCKETTKMYCSDESVAECIRTLASDCDRG